MDLVEWGGEFSDVCARETCQDDTLDLKWFQMWETQFGCNFGINCNAVYYFKKWGWFIITKAQSELSSLTIIQNKIIRFSSPCNFFSTAYDYYPSFKGQVCFAASYLLASCLMYKADMIL